MYNSHKVIWHEGLFLEPQHFQQQERYFEALTQHYISAQGNNFWGFLSLDLDLDLLPIGQFNIKNAKGIFPDGTFFELTNNEDLPVAIDIPEGLTNAIIYLVIAKKYSADEAGVLPTVDNTNDNELNKDNKLNNNTSNSNYFRYKILSKQVANTIQQSQHTTDLDVGIVHCQLLINPPNLNDYSYLPITRVVESRSNFQILLDKAFIPTWLNIHAVPVLSHYVTEVHKLLTHRAEMLSARLTDSVQAQTAEFIDYMILQLVNKYEPLFHYLAKKPLLHPEQLFMILIQLMGEMATFTNDKRRPIEPPVYNHTDLFTSFKLIIQQIRHSLSMVLEQNAIAIGLEHRGRGLWTGQVPDKALIKEAQFILAVYADMPLENLRSMISNQLKIAPFELIENLVSRALPGVPVESLAVAPRQIPYQSSFCYFTIKNKHELWQQLSQSTGLAMHLGGNVPGITFELWAIKG